MTIVNIKAWFMKYRPPRLALLMLSVAVIAHWTTPLGNLIVYSNFLFGAILGLIGFLSMNGGWWQFRQANTSIHPTASTSFLVTNGLYRITRNPMYLGIIAMLFGVAVMVGSLPFYLASIIYFLIINYIFCPFEEQHLAQEAGESYVKYIHNVRRWM